MTHAPPFAVDSPRWWSSGFKLLYHLKFSGATLIYMSWDFSPKFLLKVTESFLLVCLSLGKITLFTGKLLFGEFPYVTALLAKWRDRKTWGLLILMKRLRVLKWPTSPQHDAVLLWNKSTEGGFYQNLFFSFYRCLQSTFVWNKGLSVDYYSSLLFCLS